MKLIKDKKGVELTLNTIIVFIILLIVMIVVILFFSEHFTTNNDSITNIGKDAILNAKNLK